MNQSLIDSLQQLTETGVNAYQGVRAADANVQPTTAKPKASAFNWKPWAIGAGVIVLGVVIWRAVKK